MVGTFGTSATFGTAGRAMDTLPRPAAADAPGFDALVAESLALLPAHAPEWTNHNASDPGITLVELLAYFTDLLLYRLGRVGNASRLEFLRLLRGGDLGAPGTGDDAAAPSAQAVRDAIDRTLAEMSQLDCAVTPLDHEQLVEAALSALPWGAESRVRCLAQTDLAHAARRDDVAAGQHPGHASVVVFAPAGCPPAAREALLAAARAALAPRRLLTSRVHVVAPVTLQLGVRLWATPAPGADRAQLASRIADALNGWLPQGSANTAPTTLALAEIADRAAAVEQVEGIDGIALLQAALRPDDLLDGAFDGPFDGPFAGLFDEGAAIGVQIGLRSTLGRDSRLGGPPPLARGRLLRDGDGALAAIALRPWEVARVALRPQDVVWSGTTAAAATSARNAGDTTNAATGWSVR